VGLILDSSVVIAAERQGRSVLQILEHIKAACGEVEIGLSVITMPNSRMVPIGQIAIR
jgi:hypothetical protein